MMMKFGNLLLMAFCFLPLNQSVSFAELTNRDYAVEVEVEILSNPKPEFHIKWNKDISCIYQVIGKYAPSRSEWDSIAVLDNLADNFIDTNVVVGQKYEYFIRRYFEDRTAYTYFCSGLDVPEVNEKGRLLLLIDRTLINPLNKEISTFIDDLEEDGWKVERYNVNKTELFNSDEVHKIKSIMMLQFYKYMWEFKSTILLGRVAVPYSGAYAIDAHMPDHFGAYPSDVYYQTFQGSWSDSIMDTKDADRSENWNIPFDGKFDNNVIPSDAMFSLGRIDFYNLPIFKESEIELLRRYLNKNHNYRQNLIETNKKALIDDKFKFYLQEYWGSDAWMNFSALVNSKNIDTSSLTMPLISEKEYLFYYGCSGGSWDICGNVMTSDYASKNKINAVFVNLFGSYFIDWDCKNNLMRSVMASEGKVLNVAWNGRPYLWYQHLGIGENIGYSIMQSQNNQGLYIANDKWGYRQNHISLLGDPTLTIFNVFKPTELNIKQIGADTENKILQISWKAPEKESEIIAYNVYKYNFSEKKYKFINKVQGFEFIDSTANLNLENKYLIKTLKRLTSNTAIYLKESQGASISDNLINSVKDLSKNSNNDVIINGDCSSLINELSELQQIDKIEVIGIDGTNIALLKDLNLMSKEILKINNGVYMLKIKAKSILIVKKILIINN
jgi:hypothetical protein